uniref:uncharacterized protein LOC131123020 n=1 Tax=Doryrhamphus excisus TaxID=161450 RepID=UPI0025ADA27A|nr:uncharacterized protein LOC131123020 [Doryrhamphus excisus]
MKEADERETCVQRLNAYMRLGEREPPGPRSPAAEVHAGRDGDAEDAAGRRRRRTGMRRSFCASSAESREAAEAQIVQHFWYSSGCSRVRMTTRSWAQSDGERRREEGRGEERRREEGRGGPLKPGCYILSLQLDTPSPLCILLIVPAEQGPRTWCTKCCQSSTCHQTNHPHVIKPIIRVTSNMACMAWKVILVCVIHDKQ